MISILMPVHNLPDLTVKALESIPRRNDIEVVIVDDSSTDGTYTVLRDYLPTSKLNYVLERNEENMRTGMTLNRCLSLSHGDYVTQLDNDDEYFPDFERVLEYLDSDLVWFDMRVNNGDVWSPNTRKEICDHGCLFRRSIIGDSRWPDKPNGGGWFLMQQVLKKPHTERYTNILAYKYNFPREGSVLYELSRK